MSDLQQATRLLHRATEGRAGAVEELFALAYAELRRVAAGQLRRERPDHTLRPTELVHEAYLRTFDQTRCDWKNRTQFLAVASQAMRRILIDHARRRQRHKRGGAWERIPLEDAASLGSDDAHTTLLALDVALERFARERPDKARIVEMHVFGGMTHEECAEALGISLRTVSRHWNYAQAWLYREMSGEGPAPS